MIVSQLLSKTKNVAGAEIKMKKLSINRASTCKVSILTDIAQDGAVIKVGGVDPSVTTFH